MVMIFNAKVRAAMPRAEEVVIDSVDQLLKQAMAPSEYTTTPLAAGQTYLSNIIDGKGYSRLVGSVYSDAAGTLHVEESPDGYNWDIIEEITVGAGEGKGFTIEIVCPSLRLRYVNGSTPQTVFRLYSFLRVI